MLKKILNNRFLVLYILPFFLGFLTVFSFQPFNISFVNFFILPIFFLLLVYVNKGSRSTYRKKPFYRNLFFIGCSFGFGFYLSGIFWISYALTFEESFKFLIPFAIILIPLFLSLFSGLTTLCSFSTLSISNHEGTSSMGILLFISLFSTLLSCLILLPIFMKTIKFK